MNAKKWLISALSFIIVGCIIFVGVMNMLEWDFTKLSTVRYETNGYEISDKYKDILIETKEAVIEFVSSDNPKTFVVCEEKHNTKHSVKSENGELVIELVDSRKWYEYIGISFKSPKITVYLPRGEYGTLSIKSSTGDVNIPSDFVFDIIDISLSTGDVTCNTEAEAVKIQTDTGEIFAKGLNSRSLDLTISTGHINLSDSDLGDVKINVSTGRVDLENIKCDNFVSDGSTGNMTLKNVIASGRLSIERSTGDIKLDGCDAAEIFIETDTGNVSGSLLSDKVFFAETDTGRVSVPKSMTGGRCEISTDTGNIKIDVVK